MTSMQEGQYTRTVYTLIKNRQYQKAIEILDPIVQVLPTNRAALSLLAHCYYYQGQYEPACQVYEILVRHYQSCSEYRLYHAQALYKAGELVEASRILDVLTDFPDTVMQLKMAIAYTSDQAQECRRILKMCPADAPETVQNEGCLLYKEEKYGEAMEKFLAAMDILGKTPSLFYSVALCHYKMNRSGDALKNLAHIIERGVKDHPELSVGVASAGEDVKSVGNSQALQASALVEAFNLKAAVEYRLKNLQAAKEALTDMPPRDLHELDPCTLHNRALIHMDDDPEEGFSTLSFLIDNPPFPPETFANLLLLYIKPPNAMHGFAADLLAQHPDYAVQLLSKELQAFLDAAIMRQDSPEEAFEQFERITKVHVDQMRLLTKMIQDARMSSNTQLLTQRIQEFDEELEKYIPALMAQAHIYWDMGQYSSVIKIFNQAREFASEHETWKLNVAHTYFMMETPGGKSEDSGRDNFQKAIEYYKPLVDRHKEKNRLLDVTAMVVANLCVSYIMDEKNTDAEEVIKQLEAEEDVSLAQDPTKHVHHLCIVNLVIGTLYCSKQNYEFGMSRIIKALEPLERKLEADTWFYAKRCYLALVDGLAKHMIFFNDKSYDDVLDFLDKVQDVGKDIQASYNPLDKTNKTVGSEARAIKRVLLKLRAS